MRISYLELKNYRRFKEVKLQFPDGIVGIIGPNGSGKTTLIEGIAWALFGNVEAVVRTSKESVKRVGTDASEACAAALEFELGGSEYRIEREMAGKSMVMKASLKTGERILAEGDVHVRRAVEKLIGMDQKSFFTSVFARQKELNALQNVAAGERKKAVLRMLRIDRIDTVIQKVREDRRHVEDKIEGAERHLLDEHGRDRETMLKSQLPALRKELEEAEVLLKAADEAEASAGRGLEEARSRSRELKKDADAHDASAKDLHAKRSQLDERQKNIERLDAKVEGLKGRLKRLPELEAAEREWVEASAAAEALEEGRRKAEKAADMAKDIAEQEAAREALGKDLKEAREALSKSADPEEQRTALERSRQESESRRRDISGEMGKCRAHAATSKEVASEARAKLERILAQGKAGTCPTCERTLEEAFDLLVSKLNKDVESAEADAKAEHERISALEAELRGLDKKDEALRKKAARVEEDSGRRRRLEATAESHAKQLAQMDERLSKKRDDLAALGKVDYSSDAYEKAKAERARLKPLHDDFVRLKGTEEELARTAADRASAQEDADKLNLDVKAREMIVADLEPKKAQYNEVQKVVDAKMDDFTKAKDVARSRSVKRDSAKNRWESAEKDLANIERIKKDIESDRKAKEALSNLEGVMVSFRDHLISKVAPTLEELTSHVLESTTGGRYSRVELDESYEIQVDDEGTMYPLGRFSGGEADLANLALRLAISRIIAERTGANPINFLILDEIFGSLDPERKRSVMVALNGLSAQFRQILLITHIEDIKDLMGNVVRVERTEDGTSAATLVA